MLSRTRIFAAGLLAFAASAALAAPEPGIFTIAAIPDTQNYVDYTHQKAEGFPFDARQLFFEQLQYVADNLVSNGGDIAFVAGLGDIWQHQSLRIDPDHEKRGMKAVPNPVLDAHFAPTPKVRTVEMPTAIEGYRKLLGKVPMAIIPGNHDYDAMWTDSRFPPAAQVDPKNLSTIGMLHPGGLGNYLSAFGKDSQFFKGRDWYVGAYNGGTSSAQIFEAGGYRFLHIGLEFDPPNGALQWAQSMIARYPGLPTIVTTHDYLDQQGRRLSNPIIDGAKADPEDNSPEMVWQKFISQNDQIFLVLCGHEHGQAMRMDLNKAGHTVYQLLSDYQDRSQTAKDAGVKSEWPVGIGDGWLRLMRFDMTKPQPTITVRTYSSHYKGFSTETPDYAKWYKAAERPNETDAQYLTADDFVITLPDFRARFQPVAATR